MKSRILVVDDEESIRFTFDHFLSEKGYAVTAARDYHEALSAISEGTFDLVFADIILEGKTGIDLLREIKAVDPSCPVVMITGYPHHNSASDALRLGAFDYIPKPVDQETLLRITRMALQHKALLGEKESYRSNLEAIFKSVRDAIITVSKELSVIELNDSAKEICGFSREVIGKRLDALPLLCSGTCLDAVRKTVDEQEPVEFYRLECQRKDRPGQVVTLNTFRLLKQQNIFSGTVMVARDETSLANLERNLIEKCRFHSIIGKAQAMQRVYSLIESLADVETTVLILGESGTGKELVAEALHYGGSRRLKPLVKVNCSALSENLLESELFGHVRGAFTGAIHDKTGRFQKAHGGSLFLDEIGDISPATQLRLLRVLQQKEFERVGDHNPIKVDVRIIAATNRDLRQKVRNGEFREDLFYRLRVVEIALPPLRERREDIPLLVDHFIRKFNGKFGKEIVALSSEVRKIFMEYPWPGNIRELEHAIEHAFILSRQNIIVVDDLDSELKDLSRSPMPSLNNTKDTDQQALLQALEKAGGNKSKAARLLGISRRTVHRKVRDLNIVPEDLT
ncbi:MAG TPA: sigma-54-dependent Fis family transcriptional regulator [Thermodesulfovibrionales bacterium]|nr:sigma-54-dependent Fis family transcriptional regulator [Thermodesulfovibrionales bacterium]